MDIFSGVKRLAMRLFGSKKSPRRSVSKRRHDSPNSVPASKKSVTRTSAERKANLAKEANKIGRDKREATRKEKNAEPPVHYGYVGRRHNTREPFHMPTNRFNSNMGSLSSLNKKERNPANIVKYMQKYAVQERFRGMD